VLPWVFIPTIQQVIPAETAMKEPQNFIKVLMVTMLGSSINYMSFGLICYLVRCSHFICNLSELYACTHVGINITCPL